MSFGQSLEIFEKSSGNIGSLCNLQSKIKIDQKSNNLRWIHCPVSGNAVYPYSPDGRSLKIKKGGGISKAQLCKVNMKLNWDFQKGGEWILSERTQS